MGEGPGATCIGVIWTDPDGTEHVGRFAGANPLAIAVNETRVVPHQVVVGMWQAIETIKAANVRGDLPCFTTAHVLETFRVKYEGWSTSFSFFGGRTEPVCVNELRDAFWEEPVYLGEQFLPLVRSK